MSLWNVDYVIPNRYSRPGIKLVGVRGIVMHWTANPGGSDEGHQKFFDGADGGGGRAASAHFFVDSDSATLILPLNEVGYHANDHACRIDKLKASKDGYVGGANLTAIGIEMCVERDGTIHPNTITQSVQIAAELCKRYNLTADDIYRHFDVTGKNCPAPWVTRSDLFANFKKRVAVALSGTQAKPVPTPVKPAPVPSKPVVQAPKDQYAIGLVEYLKSVGEDPSFDNRSKLAAKYGIANYRGTAVQNVQLLALVREGKKPAPAPKPKTTPAVTGIAVPSYPGKVFKQGSTGMDVERIQRAVKAKVDGVYGPNTVSAVKKYQARHGLGVDGKVGPATWNKMF